jgi:hypothetical protein
MKFNDLEINQRFELDGVVYVKTSPVLAGKADGGGTKFMARYVMVKLLDGEAPRAKVAQEKMLRAEAMLAAFEAYHARCREAIEAVVPADRMQEIADVLEGERQGFLDAVLKG